MSIPDYSIPIAATFTAEPIKNSLAFWLRKLGLSGNIVFAPYNQVFQQLLDASSLFNQNVSGINVILLRLEDWVRNAPTDGNSSGERGDPVNFDPVSALQQDIETLVTTLIPPANPHIPYLILICPPSPRVLVDAQLVSLFYQMEEYLGAQLASANGVYLVSTTELATLYPVTDYYDDQADQWGHLPYTPAFFTALGTMVARKMYALRHAPYKVIVLDCDQTLWKGVCGEGGNPLEEIVIDPSRKRLQEFMISQYDQGMLLCLCSRNNEADVLRLFNEHPEMILKLKHIISRRINWDPKSSNIISLAGELNLGLDSFIFLDDDPVMCAEVRANCPEVLTLTLPRDDDTIPQFLQHTWAFDHLKVTSTDAQRTILYRQNLEREQLQKNSSNLVEFLSHLNLHVQITEASADQYERIAQLTQRTNQFNVTSIRRTEREISELIQTKTLECLVVNVEDRFGDYGLVGVVLFRIQGNTLAVDTLLLSCRALGRRVEHQIVARLGAVARERSAGCMTIPFHRTDKNQPAWDFLDRLGASRHTNGADSFVFRLPASQAVEVQAM